MNLSLDSYNRELVIAVCVIVLVVTYLWTRSDGESKSSSNNNNESNEPKVTVYGTYGCGWTVRWLDALKENNVDFKFVDCNETACPAVSGYPHTKVEGKEDIVGFDQSRIADLK